MHNLSVPTLAGAAATDSVRELRRTKPDLSAPRVLIYADPLLAPSVTFVKSQAEALCGFVPYYAGARAFRGPGLALPKDRVVLINRTGSNLGKIKEVPFKLFGYAPRFYRRLRRINPVLVHAHGGPSALTILPMSLRLRVPLVATFHGSDVTVDPSKARGAHYTAKAYWRRMQVLQEGGDLFIAVSEFVRRKLLEQGYPSEKTVLHYIGIDIDFFKASADAEREPVVLFVGTLHEVKGCEYLIRAMMQVQKAVPAVQLVVIGDGPLRPHLEATARKHIGQCTFLGAQPQDVVRDWMERARVFCVPSVTDKCGATEALGLVFLEAQAMELPVASFRSGGIPEAVAHDETGLLATEKDSDSLAANITLVLTNRELWNRMGKAGRKRVEARFNLAKQTTMLEKLYQQVLCSKRGELTADSRN